MELLRRMHKSLQIPYQIGTNKQNLLNLRNFISLIAASRIVKILAVIFGYFCLWICGVL
jgi:hypothetical protein